jgi:hypothetical protein
MAKLPIVSGAEAVIALQRLGFFVDRQRSAKKVRGATRLWDNSFDVHHANFQCRVVWPKGDQPSPKPFYLELTA